MTPTGTSNELDVQNKCEENTHTRSNFLPQGAVVLLLNVYAKYDTVPHSVSVSGNKSSTSLEPSGGETILSKDRPFGGETGGQTFSRTDASHHELREIASRCTNESCAFDQRSYSASTSTSRTFFVTTRSTKENVRSERLTAMPMPD